MRVCFTAFTGFFAFFSDAQALFYGEKFSPFGQDFTESIFERAAVREAVVGGFGEAAHDNVAKEGDGC